MTSQRTFANEEHFILHKRSKRWLLVAAAHVVVGFTAAAAAFAMNAAGSAEAVHASHRCTRYNPGYAIDYACTQAGNLEASGSTTSTALRDANSFYTQYYDEIHLFYTGAGGYYKAALIQGYGGSIGSSDGVYAYAHCARNTPYPQYGACWTDWHG